MNNLKKALLAGILSGLFFSLAWPEFGSLNILLFFAFIPLLYIQDEFSKIQRGGGYILLCAYLAFFTWNIITTYWLLCVEGSPATIFISGFLPSFVNALLMLLPFWLFHKTKSKLGDFAGYVSLPIFWLAMEYGHLRWDLTWTWLEIGNAFAANPSWIQWYEYTGVHGGTLWVIVANIWIYKTLVKVKPGERKIYQALPAFAWIAFPLVFSILLYYSNTQKGPSEEVVIIQPNLDPYNEKFEVAYDEQMRIMMQQVEAHATENTSLFIFPETALQERTNAYIESYGRVELAGLWENTLDSSNSLRILRPWMAGFSGKNLITGLSTDSLYPLGISPTPTSRALGNSGFFYDSYNTAMLLNADTLQLYHKSKLVPAVERLPFVAYVKPILGNAALDFGGTSGGLGYQEEREVFKCINSEIVAAPVICYESVYGEFNGDYILKGANLITIITNDGWWGNSPGHKHHLAYARLRAIEHRRDIARSANTGISAIINQRGDIVQSTKYWEKATLVGNVHLNEELTFYTKAGDYLGRSSFILALALILWIVIIRIINPRKTL